MELTPACEGPYTLLTAAAAIGALVGVLLAEILNQRRRRRHFEAQVDGWEQRIAQRQAERDRERSVWEAMDPKERLWIQFRDRSKYSDLSEAELRQKFEKLWIRNEIFM